MTVTRCQRWRAKRDSYRPASEPIDPSRYGVEVLHDDATPKAFVQAHHYAGTFPAARCRVGLYRMRELVGVAVFSVPAQSAAIPRWCGTSAGVELGRFVLLDDVPANGETWFLARAFRALVAELPDVRAVLSYSDPLPRPRWDGSLLTPGHVGTIYMAFNGRYEGQTRAEWQWIDGEGRTVSPRALSKLRNEERGAEGVYRRMLERGAPARIEGEDWRAYVPRALREGPFRRIRHPGNHAYVWAVGEGREETAQGFPAAQPYPRRDPQLGLGVP